MKKYFLSVAKWSCLFVFGLLVFSACQKDPHTYAIIETTHGNMKVMLYNTTPLHRDNFVKLANEGFYDDLLFHRVIRDFMIQGGDPQSRNAPPGQTLGVGGPGYTIPAEIGSPHFKGALSAARLGNDVNPQRESSGSQFFIVHGTPQTDQHLNGYELQKGIKYSEVQRKLYREIGGFPSLDNEYTVFGEVVEGLEVVEKIASEETKADRPVKDVKMKIRILN